MDLFKILSCLIKSIGHGYRLDSSMPNLNHEALYREVERCLEDEPFLI